ncbi:hypothetical protein [Enterococcus timonensis]|uniref:hypothetical protein n=1 Tax=Enterococcus timonensis TaxID=1852364 RepID=UPI0008D9A33C|nr:hypothetical protein [Enterococcus timonensis]
MTIIVFIGYFLVRLLVNGWLKKKVPAEQFILQSNKIYTFTSLIFGVALLASGAANDFWGRVAGFLLLADSFLSCLLVIHFNKRPL